MSKENIGHTCSSCGWHIGFLSHKLAKYLLLSFGLFIFIQVNKSLAADPLVIERSFEQEGSLTDYRFLFFGDYPSFSQGISQAAYPVANGRVEPEITSMPYSSFSDGWWLNDEALPLGTPGDYAEVTIIQRKPSTSANASQWGLVFSSNRSNFMGQQDQLWMTMRAQGAIFYPQYNAYHLGVNYDNAYSNAFGFQPGVAGDRWRLRIMLREIGPTGWKVTCSAAKNEGDFVDLRFETDAGIGADPPFVKGLPFIGLFFSPGGTGTADNQFIAVDDFKVVLQSPHDPIPSGLSIPAEALSHSDDYTYGFYPYGIDQTDPQGNIIYAVQTNQYALRMNASKGRIDALGPIANSLSGDEALTEPLSVISGLAFGPIEFSVRVGSEDYLADLGATTRNNVHIYRMGQFFQHFEVVNIRFRNISGTQLNNIAARIEFFCWSDRVSAVLHFTPSLALTNVTLSSKIPIPAAYSIVESMGTNLQVDALGTLGVASPTAIIRNAQGEGMAILAPRGQTLRRSASNQLVCETTVQNIGAGNERTLPVVFHLEGSAIVAAARCETRELVSPLSGNQLTLQAKSPYFGAQPIAYDPVMGCYFAQLDTNQSIWELERNQLTVSNPDDEARTLRLNFNHTANGFPTAGISAVLRDAYGFPTGLPMQLSKRWHTDPSRLDGLTMIELPPHGQLQFEANFAYANWGTASAVSHVQLDVGGWGSGIYQQWDEMALGSFGENITYDVNHGLGPSLLDDVRPFKVWSLGESPRLKYGFANNVGGGDWLVLFVPFKQTLTRLRTQYRSSFPVLSDVHFAGQALGVAIQAHVGIQSWRTEDYIRALYTLRYDVTATVENITRLAFFQIAADNYDYSVSNKMARGDLGGMLETWSPPKGSNDYTRTRQPLPGATPWLALYDSSRPQDGPTEKGPVANRGLIVRSWQARLGGVDQPTPFYSVFDHNNVSPGSLVELSPPAGLNQLNAGDYVEAQVEIMITPQLAQDYYGDDAGLIAALAGNPPGWSLVNREASGNHLATTVIVGTLEQEVPLCVRAIDGVAEFTINGGVGYVPVSITGAQGYSGFMLERKLSNGTWEPIDQSVWGHDWWQTQYNAKIHEWTITYTLPLDRYQNPAQSQTLRWSQPVSSNVTKGRWETYR